jgi:5-oxoprolinase (ATP-hydrolysing) subunit A
MVKAGRVEAIDGSIVEVDADSICVHGDTPGATALATAVRQALTEADVTLRPFVADRR